MPSITIPGNPLGQPRQRVAVIAGRARNYTPSSHPIHGFKLAIRQAWTHGMIDGPVMLQVIAVFPRPKSKTRKRGDNPRYPHTSKPDWDNVGKAVSDALNGVAYRDDQQVVMAVVSKHVAANDEDAGTWISCMPYEQI